MEIPDHLTCLLRNLDAGQEAIVETLYGTTDRFKIKKGVWQGCLLSPCLFNVYAEHIMRNARLDDYKLEQDRREKHQQPQICKWYHSNGRKQRGTKEPLDEDEGGEWKSQLKTKYLKKLRSWHPIPSFHGKQMGKQWLTFLGGDSKITADGDCMKLKDTYSLEGKLWPT